jgi:hypothetical protein
MSKITKVTKDEMLTDLQTVLYSVMEQMGRIYGDIALVDRRDGKERIRFDGRAEDDAGALKLDGLPVTEYMSMIYDYAIDGRLDKQLRNDWEIVDEDILGFFDGLIDFPLIYNNADVFPLSTITDILAVFRARRCLDHGAWVIGDDYSTVDGYVQLKDVALLAGIDEKTARNLANPHAKNRLVTEKWKGRTLVAVDVARNWLIQRGYQDTVEFDSMLDRDLEKRGFWSLADLGEYVQGHREKSNMAIEALGAKAGLDSDGLVWLAALEAGHASFDKDRLHALAVALGISPKAFVLAALKEIQSFQIRELEAQFAT